jgi:hypothetical protein
MVQIAPKISAQSEIEGNSPNKERVRQTLLNREAATCAPSLSFWKFNTDYPST